MYCFLNNGNGLAQQSNSQIPLQTIHIHQEHCSIFYLKSAIRLYFGQTIGKTQKAMVRSLLCNQMKTQWRRMGEQSHLPLGTRSFHHSACCPCQGMARPESTMAEVCQVTVGAAGDPLQLH